MTNRSSKTIFDGARTKSLRLKEISESLSKIEKMERKKVLAFIQYKWGLSKAKADEYLEILIDMSHFVEEEDGSITGYDISSNSSEKGPGSG